MARDDHAERLLREIDALMALVKRQRSLNGGKVAKVTLKEVRKHLQRYHETNAVADLFKALELMSAIVMGER